MYHTKLSGAGAEAGAAIRIRSSMELRNRNKYFWLYNTVSFVRPCLGLAGGAVKLPEQL